MLKKLKNWNTIYVAAKAKSTCSWKADESRVLDVCVLDTAMIMSDIAMQWTPNMFSWYGLWYVWPWNIWIDMTDISDLLASLFMVPVLCRKLTIKFEPVGVCKSDSDVCILSSSAKVVALVSWGHIGQRTAGKICGKNYARRNAKIFVHKHHIYEAIKAWIYHKESTGRGCKRTTRSGGHSLAFMSLQSRWMLGVDKDECCEVIEMANYNIVSFL